MCGSKLYWRHHYHHHHHHHHCHLANKELGHLLTRSELTLLEVSLMVSYGFFCLLVCSLLLFPVIYYEFTYNFCYKFMRMSFISRLYSLSSGYMMTPSYIWQANSWSRKTSHPQHCTWNTVSPTPPAEDRRNRPIQWCLSDSCSNHTFRLCNTSVNITTQHALSLSRLLSRLVWRQS